MSASHSTPGSWFSSNSTKVYECLKCGHRTPLFRSICAHLRRHTRAACCDICGKDYNTIWEARQHLALAHPSRGSLDYEQVSRTVGPGELLVEVTKLTIDGDETKRQLRGAFQCPLCDFQTWWASAVYEHLLVAPNHHDELPCDLCGEPIADHRPSEANGEPEHTPLDCFRVDDEDIDDVVYGVRSRIEP